MEETMEFLHRGKGNGDATQVFLLPLFFPSLHTTLELSGYVLFAR
jgi:hypothetical protein